MSFYRRRSYGGGGYRKKSSGGRVRRTLKTQLTPNGATLVTASVAIPVDSTRNVGINIHDFKVDIGLPDITIAEGDFVAVWLNRNTPAAERRISDVDCIAKVKVVSYYGSDVGQGNYSSIFTEHFSPPIPIFQDEIRACCIAVAGMSFPSTTIDIEVAYTLAWMTVAQIVGVAKNIII